MISLDSDDCKREPLRSYVPLNLSTLKEFIKNGRIDASKPIDMKDLFDCKAVNGVRQGVKLLGRVQGTSYCKSHSLQGRDEFDIPVNITVSQASQ